MINQWISMRPYWPNGDEPNISIDRWTISASISSQLKVRKRCELDVVPRPYPSGLSHHRIYFKGSRKHGGHQHQPWQNQLIHQLNYHWIVVTSFLAVSNQLNQLIGQIPGVERQFPGVLSPAGDRSPVLQEFHICQLHLSHDLPAEHLTQATQLLVA